MKYQHIRLQLPMKVRKSAGPVLRTPEDCNRVCRDMACLEQESFHVLILDKKHRLRERVMVSLGLQDAALVHPREVFRPAIEHSASGIILVHNHPSGDTTPSAEDLRITRQLVEASKIIDIELLDHVIIGETIALQEGKKEFTSIRESGLVQFN